MKNAGKRGMSRRQFLGGAATAAIAGISSPTLSHHSKTLPTKTSATLARRQSPSIKKAIVLGIDGMDTRLFRALLDQRQLPAFEKLIRRGSYSPLRTTVPPQSPVAWASFISGADPGIHGIYDFIHRDPSSLSPYLSTSKTIRPEDTLRIGTWQLPLSQPQVKLLRKGPAFWNVLAEYGIPSVIIQIPANYPAEAPSPLIKSVSGMGTPDMLGTYGTYTVFTELPVPEQAKGKEGRWVHLKLDNHSVVTQLEGPANQFRADEKPATVELKIHRDSREKTLKISVQGQDIILEQGGWSDWIPLSFEMIPFISSARGMVRFHAGSIHPQLRLYCSPINIDPLTPDLPISTPPGYSAELAGENGRFYTQGLPSDTKALSSGALDTEEFYHQSRLVLGESLHNFEKTISQFKEGLYFFYFSSLDQSSHMMWRLMDPANPLYEPALPPEVKDGIINFYRQMDWVVARALEKTDEDTLLIVMSDHGFVDFLREFNASTWMVKEGFTRLDSEWNIDKGEFFEHVDWDNTKAYCLGINSVYLNLRGREQYGSVSPEDAEALKHEIIDRLESVVDPKTGRKAVIKAWDGQKAWTRPDPLLSPDIVVGYADGYRISDRAVLGGGSSEVFSDRRDPWSADHCVDPSVVPGVLVTNRRITSENPAIWDLAPSILKAFGVEAPAEMTGVNILA